MTSKSDKEKKVSKKASPKPNEDTPKKTSPKVKKQEEDDDDDEEGEPAKPKASKKAVKGLSGKDDEDDDDVEEVEDEWEKVEEDDWDPDFDEFDLPKSKTKKASPGTGAPRKKEKSAGDDDLGIDDDFKEMDLFNESSFDDDEDDF